MSLLESGRREPTPRTLEILAQRLGCTVEYLRDGISPEEGRLGILRLLRAELALRSGAAREADELLEDGTAVCGDPLPQQRAEYIRALVREELGAPEEAVRLLEELAATTDESVQWLTPMVALARCCRKIGQVTRSIEIAEGVLARMADLGASGVREEAEARGLLMLALNEAGMTSEALVHARKNLAAGSTPSQRQRAETYRAASQRAEESGRLTEAVWLAERGVALLSAAEDDRTLAELQTLSASLLMRGDEADPGELLSVLTEAHRVLLAYGSPADVGRCEVELARAMLLSADATAAVGWAEQAMSHLEGGQDVLALAWGRLVLGRGLFELEQADPALGQVRAATALLRGAPSSVRTAEAWRQAGELLRELHQETAALDALSQALAVVGVGHRW